jgi:hypothetical protein
MKLFLITFCLAFSLTSFADQETRNAVSNVQEQMKKPEFHKNAAKESGEAAAVESHVKQISGGAANEQEMYNLAAEVLGNMKDMKPEDMQKMLEQAKKNPEAFMNSWTPEQKQKLKELSERIPAGQKRNP